MKGESEMNSIVGVNEVILAESNEAIIQVAGSLGVKPSNLVARMKEFLPVEVEQNLYLAVAKDFTTMKPETFAGRLQDYVHISSEAAEKT